jgi:hypothetical protein
MPESRRLFTVARANRALPLVARIVGDVVRKHEELRRLEEERSGARHERPEAIERRRFDLEGEIEQHVQELAELGCELKDPRQGLLDFPAQDGRQPLILCWKMGEKRVEWWHPVDAGFAGRRPVSELPAETRGE